MKSKKERKKEWMNEWKKNILDWNQNQNQIIKNIYCNVDADGEIY